MSKALRNSGKHVRLALAGVAAIMLGGCADSSRVGDPFADPFKTSARLDRTPTGSTVAQADNPGSPVANFFTDAFKPFDDHPAPAPAPAAPHYSAPKELYRPPVAVESRPLAAPSAAASAAPVFRPAAPAAPASIVRAGPNGVGGWTAEGGAPVVVAQGETAATIATRYGVPTNTLLSLNGYTGVAQVQPGARLVIPVYHANGAVRAAAAPVETRPAVAAAPKPAAKPAAKPDPAVALAEKRAKLAQAKADQQARKMAEAKAAQEKAAQVKAAQIAAADAKAKTLKAEADQARAAKMAAAKMAAAKTAAGKTVVAKTVVAKSPVVQPLSVQPIPDAKKFAAAKPAANQKTQVATAAPTPVQPAPVQIPAKPQAAVTPPADATASLPSPSTSASAGDSANPEFRWPARGRVIQSFGAGGNDGINIAVPEGTQVKAAEGGVVAYAGSELKGYGNLVLIRHPNGFVTAYANNGSINVKRGDTVKRGQTIALSGQTGNVASPQLHFELRKGQKPVDPSNYLAGL